MRYLGHTKPSKKKKKKKKKKLKKLSKTSLLFQSKKTKLFFRFKHTSRFCQENRCFAFFSTDHSPIFSHLKKEMILLVEEDYGSLMSL